MFHKLICFPVRALKPPNSLTRHFRQMRLLSFSSEKNPEVSVRNFRRILSAILVVSKTVSPNERFLTALLNEFHVLLRFVFYINAVLS